MTFGLRIMPHMAQPDPAVAGLTTAPYEMGLVQYPQTHRNLIRSHRWHRHLVERGKDLRGIRLRFATSGDK